MHHTAFELARIAMFAGATYCAFGQIPTVIQIDGSPRPGWGR